MDKNDRKVCVIGLDGATFDVIKPLVAQGKLPNLARLMQEGLSQALPSVIPPITTSAWTSFMTGKNPGKHGIFHFRATPSDMDCEEFTSGAFIGCKTMWETFTENDVQVGVVNMPMAYPVHPVKGFMISGMMTPSESVQFAHPPEILDEIKQAVGEYHLDPKVQALGAAALEQWVQGFFDVEEQRGKAIVHLVKEKPWDLFVAIVDITDRVGHLCWRYYRQQKDGAPERVRKDVTPLLRDGIVRCYELADKIVGDILRELPDDTTVLVMSDHGFGSCEKLFYTNEWLSRNGWLSPRRATPFNYSKVHGWQVRRTTLENILVRMGANALRRRLPRKMLERVIVVPILRRRQSSYSINWRRTKAYGAGRGIYINLKGRQPEGTVEPGEEYERLRDEILTRLRGLKDPQTGELVVTHAYRREEIYKGAFTEDAPDILFGLNHLAYVQVDQLVFGRLFRPSRGGTHRMEGILMMKGTNVNPQASLGDICITDIAPTLHYLLGLPVPDDMDGHVLTGAFNADYVASHPVETIHVEQEDVRRRGELNPDDAAELEKRLKLLGYIG